MASTFYGCHVKDGVPLSLPSGFPEMELRLTSVVAVRLSKDKVNSNLIRFYLVDKEMNERFLVAVLDPKKGVHQASIEICFSDVEEGQLYLVAEGGDVDVTGYIYDMGIQSDMDDGSSGDEEDEDQESIFAEMVRSAGGHLDGADDETSETGDSENEYSEDESSDDSSEGGDLMEFNERGRRVRHQAVKPRIEVLDEEVNELRPRKNAKTVKLNQMLAAMEDDDEEDDSSFVASDSDSEGDRGVSDSEEDSSEADVYEDETSGDSDGAGAPPPAKKADKDKDTASKKNKKKNKGGTDGGSSGAKASAGDATSSQSSLSRSVTCDLCNKKFKS
eukprot:CAMPEP_0119149376 /NCGR_PEP_ID=MMETSP1310-20130426/43232_1 /TAXON_ID=464262 /ORGANISM="Genus nov. species nov., Strain RCC2339" /LENGTH=331 /DNA_ID=CAMNT_0007141483 /DNA_START=73 /DNA_END=1065 /DNA_ORIENTATION=+